MTLVILLIIKYYTLAIIFNIISIYLRQHLAIPIFRLARPTSILEFSVRGWVCVRKFEEAELTMTIKMKVVTLDEQTPRRQFFYLDNSIIMHNFDTH